MGEGARQCDAATGALLEHRFFPGGSKLFAAAGARPDGLVALGVGFDPEDGGAAQFAVLFIRTDEPSFEQLHVLSWPASIKDIVGVSWDGEAFAVHGFANDNKQYVTRMAEDGTVLLPPTPFGIASGYPSDIRYATDPTSGVSFGVSSFFGLTLVAHQRDGTPIPLNYPNGGVFVPNKDWGADGKNWGSGVDSHAALVATPAGVAVTWSGDGGEENTFVQLVDASLQASAPTIPLPAKYYAGTTVYDTNLWLAIQPLPDGWWLAGAAGSLDEYIVQSGSFATRRTLVSYSDKALAQGVGFDARYFESVRYKDEIWLGFSDLTDKVTGAQPYRIVRAKPECAYKSMIDLSMGW